jgi:hypothetical protein
MKCFKSGLEKLAACFVAVMALVSLGCGSDGGGGTAVAQPGTVSVSLTDAPACGYEAVVVTVREVRIHESSSVDNLNGAGWRRIVLDTPRPINLLDLNDPTQDNFALEYLGETPLPAGHYTQLRLILEENDTTPNSDPSNYIVLEGGDLVNDRIALDTPSGIRTGIKLIHQFTVGSGQRVDLLLDFDACHSIVQTGNGTYKLKPVIKVIPYVLNGIEGYLDLALFPGGLNTNHVAVSAQVGGEIIRTVVPNSSVDQNNPNRGKFFIPRLTPGDYDVVITARNSPIDTCCATAVITGVPVPTETSITRISTLDHRFTLQGSTFHTIGDTVGLINPPATDDRDDATVIVVAKQALSGGPTVTVRSQVASLRHSDPETVGDYEYGLVLPIVAPSRGAYGSLPIPLSPTAVAGIYSIHGSAQTPTASYTIQSPALPSVNISGGNDPTRDFTLAPVAP